MSRRTGPRVLTWVAVLTMVVSLIGFVVSLILNAFVLDEYDAYGEVPIPGSANLHLPEGDVTVTFHTVLIGSNGGGGLPVPPLRYRIAEAGSDTEPELTEDYGATTTVNNDARVRIGYLHVPVEGNYDVNIDGDVGAYLNPRLAFGHGSSYTYLPIVFAVVFGLAVIGLFIARFWASRVRAGAPDGIGYRAPPVYPNDTPTWSPPAEPFTPTDQGIRIQQLNTLARLRDSGALTDKEFEAEKKRLLDGR